MTRHQVSNHVTRHRAVSHPLTAVVVAVLAGFVLGGAILGVSWLLGVWMR